MLVCLACPKQAQAQHNITSAHRDEAQSASPHEAAIDHEDEYDCKDRMNYSPKSKQEYIKSFTNQVKEIMMKLSTNCAPPRRCMEHRLSKLNEAEKYDTKKDVRLIKKKKWRRRRRKEKKNQNEEEDGDGDDALGMEDNEELCMRKVEKYMKGADGEDEGGRGSAGAAGQQPQPQPYSGGLMTWERGQKRSGGRDPAAAAAARRRRRRDRNVAGGGSADEEEEQEEEYWVAQVEPGVSITFLALPDGSNSVKRIRFCQEMFSKWEAQRWWAENYEMVCELYSVSSKGPSKNCEQPQSSSSSSSSCSSSSNHALWNTPQVASNEGSPTQCNSASYSSLMIQAKLMQLYTYTHGHERHDEAQEDSFFGNKCVVNELFIHEMMSCNQSHKEKDQLHEEEKDSYFSGANHQSNSAFLDPFVWGSSTFRGVENRNMGFNSVYVNLQLHADEEEEYENNDVGNEVVDHDHGSSNIYNNSRHSHDHDLDIMDHDHGSSNIYNNSRHSHDHDLDIMDHDHPY